MDPQEGWTPMIACGWQVYGIQCTPSLISYNLLWTKFIVICERTQAYGVIKIHPCIVHRLCPEEPIL
ncbi:hypothetical protein O6P43_007401 [Quillaja saponaria]|uniref:Uncharacterized protein n=1 Tax=Quillaja saponaria TaxID=32244 RepID=A0AAD7QAD7_QUISA|nr:hypothetical protein O6P43_007401 [Quillaja saponaria]